MSRSFAPLAPRSIVRSFSNLACIAGVLFGAGSALGQGLYQAPAPTLATGTVPQGVAAADFARSGFESLVVTDSTNSNMKVYLATGAAAFGSATTYHTCTNPVSVIAEDVNQDGYPDIIVACPSSNGVELFLNNGASGPGTFGGNTLGTATDPVGMVTGDFNNDGKVDLAVASGTGGLTIYLDVAGNLVTKTATVTGTLTGIVTGDFNHDGNLDLAVSDSANSNVHLLTGDGAGDFGLAGSYSTGAGSKPSGIAAADFNNDGNLDVATTNAGTNTATVLLGSASGALTAQAAQATGTNPIAISVTDVNSDGYPDVVAFDSPTASTGAVAVLLGNGDGSLQTAQLASQSFAPGTLAAVADFNRDGKPDLALTQQTANKVSLLLNNTLPTQYPDGRSYASIRKLTNGYGNMADGVAVGDFNKDGLLDIAVSYLSDNVVRVLLNNGNGFSPATAYSTGKQPYWVASGDLNGDGYPDLVTANTTDGTISVLLNSGKSGNGTFGAAATYTVGKQPYQVAIGDVNNDGYPDLAVTNYGANTVTILFGSKAGTFTAQPTLSTCANPYGVGIGDFAHNGYPSVAVTCYSSAQLEVFPNNGNGTFGTPFMTATDKNPSSLVVGDFNRDGNLDIVVGNTTANDVYFYAGNGANSFAAGVESPSLNFPDSIAAGDVNGDGILDIVGVAPNFNDVVVTLGKGDGTFGSFQQRSAGEFGAAKQPWAVALGDFNNDGQLDIVTANTYSQVNIASPAGQARYMAEYPAIPAGNPSIDVLTNTSAATISLAVSPSSPLSANNSGATLTATVQPAYSGGTPTGSVIFEDASGTPYGTGPYTLSGGTATANTGRLGSGQYLFTTLYSGDGNYQPTTASGAAFAVTVSGTPVTLTLNPSTVQYANTFSVSTTVTGTTGLGAPQGTVTIYGVNGTNTFTLGTITLTALGNNGTGTATYTATGPNLNVGNYQIYGYFTPSNGTYQPGSSSNVLLTVTGEPTNISLNCALGLLSSTCTATVDAATTNTPVPSGTIVNFTGPGGNAASTVGANGKATYSFNEVIGFFTVTATFPQQSNYLASPTASYSGGCIFICFIRRAPSIALTSFTGLEAGGNFFARPADRNRGRNVPFTLF